MYYIRCENVLIGPLREHSVDELAVDALEATNPAGRTPVPPATTTATAAACIG